MDVFERGKIILETGSDEWYWKGGKEDGPVGTHPPADTRRDKIRKAMIFLGGEKSALAGDYVREIIKILWEKTKPLLIEKYESNVKLDPRWNQN